MKVFVCVEHMADGPIQFAVDSRATFDELAVLNELGSGESDAWGGLKFDIDPTDEEYEDCYGNNIDVETVDPITSAKIATVKTANNCPDAVGDDHLGYTAEDNLYEAAYMTLVHGW
ncbi:MAG: hypothetical protein V3T23_05720 [Nitrososphaerales archaeon]